MLIYTNNKLTISIIKVPFTHLKITITDRFHFNFSFCYSKKFNSKLKIGSHYELYEKFNFVLKLFIDEIDYWTERISKIILWKWTLVMYLYK